MNQPSLWWSTEYSTYTAFKRPFLLLLMVYFSNAKTQQCLCSANAEKHLQRKLIYSILNFIYRILIYPKCKQPRYLTAPWFGRPYLLNCMIGFTYVATSKIVQNIQLFGGHLLSMMSASSTRAPLVVKVLNFLRSNANEAYHFLLFILFDMTDLPFGFSQTENISRRQYFPKLVKRGIPSYLR